MTALSLPAAACPAIRPARRRERYTRRLTGLATRARLPELLLIAGRFSC